MERDQERSIASDEIRQIRETPKNQSVYPNQERKREKWPIVW